jgi:transcription elongation GreA/GreB family factor
MLKEKILENITAKVTQDLQNATSALTMSSSYKEDSDMKSEGKYDTRAIEAGYLAGAQQKRVEELKLDLQALENVDLALSAKSESMVTGSLAQLEYNGISKKYFLSPISGGNTFNIDGEIILVVSVFSPLGQQLVGAHEGDSISVELKDQVREYLVEQVIL